ncbi:MAG: hypothetical protein AVO39_03000 [delta proteobacterium MLS_D]|jgi:holliday junction DNA helicase RuvA|nr:MAG: hypothetical protein AVO39_03000 [delta proteobacterium MLS_D]
MIASLCGVLTRKSIQSVIIDVHGVGYDVFVPLTTFYRLPEIGDTVSLIIHTHVREDAITLFGFLTNEEKAMFQLIITVSGIGPRLAVNILSGIASTELYGAIMTEDVGRLVSIPGVGRKTAERLIFELKEKLETAGIDHRKSLDESDTIARDVLSALANLGYREAAAKKAVDQALKECKDHPALESVLTVSLKILSK